MKFGIRWSAVFVMVAAWPSLVGAELLPIKTYTTADGLASDRITCIVSDSSGFIWLCTPEGLSRFDGSRFVNYGVEDGLPDRAVAALYEGHSGDRWVATARGLVRIAAGDHAPHAVPGARFVGFSFGEGTDAKSIYALAGSPSGEMWAATNAGLFEWLSPLRVRRRDLPMRLARITTVVHDPSGDLWIGGVGGIQVMTAGGAAQTFTVRDGLPGDWVEMITRDSTGRMWAALRGGLAQFRQDDSRVWRLDHVYSTGLAGTDVKAVTEATDGIVWVATTTGISRLRPEPSGFAAIENLTRAQGLVDRNITALAEDQAGNMWAGTESAGVMRIGRLGFTTYHEPDGLGSDRVWSVFEGRAGELVAVTIPQERTRTRSVDVFDGHAFRRVTPFSFADNASWSANQVLLQSRSGEWWAATHQGLCRFSAVSALELDRRRPLACYLPDASIFTLFEDSHGGIWASAQSPKGDRLMRWNPDAGTGTLREFAHPRVPSEPHETRPDDLVSAFAEDESANIWMGLYKGGLYRYDGQEFMHVRPSEGVLPRGPVLALLMAPSGLWIGTEGGGLARMERPHEPRPHVEVYNSASGLSSDIVECLVEDRSSRIYACTGKGIDRLDPRTTHIRHFSSADGLARGAFHGATRDRSGSLWFATTLGLSRLIPAQDPKPLAPHILITELRVGGEMYSVSQLGETRIALPALQPAQNQLQAEFVGIDHEPGAVIRYSYKLEGADSTWSAPRSQPSVSYAALGAGTYRFLVKAMTSDGMESVAPAEIDFTVLAPVWRRWWFVGLSVALVAAFVLAAHRYRVTQIVDLERMRTAIATDLHDDIGASLAQIAILSEVARVRGDSAGSAEVLERVATLARELVDSMGEIVWSIRSQSDDWESLVVHMRAFALDVLTSRGIAFQLRTPSTNGPSMNLQTRRQLFLMFKECIHNAARHSRCTAVVAELGAGGREVTLTVEDNGVGSNNADRTPGRAGGTGIAGMRWRAENLGGRVQITSAAGQGCRVEIHLPC